MLVSACLSLPVLSASADTTETTQTTTTTITAGATPAVISLQATGHYVVVDPITGQIQGDYDPRVKLVDGNALRAGVVIVNQSNGGPVGFVDSSGNLVDVTTSPATQSLIVSIDTRKQDLNRRIDESLNKGLLTAAQAASFRAELDHLTSDEDRDRQAHGVITYKRALMLGYGLNTLSDRLTPISNALRFQPVVAPQFVVVNGELTLLDAIDFRKHHLATRCDDEYAAGRLSSHQVSKLKEELSTISSTERKCIKNGALSSSKDRKLSELLDRLQSNMDHDVAVINQKRERIGIRAD